MTLVIDAYQAVLFISRLYFNRISHTVLLPTHITLMDQWTNAYSPRHSSHPFITAIHDMLWSRVLNTKQYVDELEFSATVSTSCKHVESIIYHG